MFGKSKSDNLGEVEDEKLQKSAKKHFLGKKSENTIKKDCDHMDNNINNVDENNQIDSNDSIKQLNEKEKLKFEKKQQKKAIKAQKKAAKKEKIKTEGHSTTFKAVRFIVCAIAFGIISLGTMYVCGDALGIINKKENSNSKATVEVAKTETQPKTEAQTTATATTTLASQTSVVDVSDIVSNVMPSIVAITSKQKVSSSMNNWYEYYFGNGNRGGNGSSNDQGDTQEETGAGSGIIIGKNDTELLIITNNHVIEGADTLEIQFIDESTVDASVKGTNSDKDLAVVAVPLDKIDSDTLSAIKIATLGDSDKLKVGEGSIAIGNALGYGQSVTTGVISALDRKVTVEDSTKTLLQTDAAINPGNSGGALLNMQGEVIGINAAKYASDSVEGMGFAIPISSVKDIIEELMNKETLTKVSDADKGYLNIYGKDVTSDLSEMYNVPEGVYIVKTIEGGSADKAGLDKSDVITKLNGDSISSMEDLQKKLEYYASGTTVTLTIQYLDNKEYKEKNVDVVLGGKME